MPDDLSVPDQFLFMAMEDLDASTQLYHRGHYPHAVFFAQQAVEKTAKSLAIALSFINDKEAATEIRHQPLNILKKTTKDIARDVHEIRKELNTRPELGPFLAAIGINVEELDSEIDKLVDQIIDDLKKKEHYDLSKKQVYKIVRELRKQAERGDAALDKYAGRGLGDAELQSINLFLEGMVRKGLSATQLSDTEKNLAVERYTHEISQIIPTKEKAEALFYILLLTVTTALLLYHLAELTAPHAVRSRYPTPAEGFDPQQYYTRDRGIVVYLPDIHFFAQKAIEQTDELYDLLTADEGEQERENAELPLKTKHTMVKKP